MDPGEIAIALAVYLLAAVVKGTTGLGFSTICLPFLVLALGLKATLPLLIIPSLASNLLMMHDAGGFPAALKRFWPMVAAGLPGLAVGLTLLSVIDPRIAGAVLGGVLIAYCLFAFTQPDLVLPPRLERPLAPLVGLLSGTVNGLTGSQVMPMVPFLVTLRLEPSLFVQANNIAFTVWSLGMAAGLSRLGLMTWEIAAISVLGLLPVYLGIKGGSALRRRLAPEVFRRAVLAILVLGGIGLIGRAVI